VSEGQVFVPLSREAFDWFSSRGKRFELRRVRAQFSERFVRRGRRVQLRRGYSGSALLGTIGKVVTAPSLAGIFAEISYELIIPNAQSESDALATASRYVGLDGPFIAFEVLLEDDVSKGPLDPPQ
jgi:hypothetical protein